MSSFFSMASPWNNAAHVPELSYNHVYDTTQDAKEEPPWLASGMGLIGSFVGACMKKCEKGIV